MKILIAPDSFKESLDAMQVACALRDGIRAELHNAEIDLAPLADGGEGTVTTLVAAGDGELVEHDVSGPVGLPVRAEYGLLDGGRTAVIEMANVCGLGLVPPAQRDPKQTTSFGCGELVCDALERGVSRIIFGIGGSATNDGGLGLVQALGVRFVDQTGKTMAQPLTGAALASIAAIDPAGLDPRLAHTTVTVACDVDNPLLGVRGATHTFGPQKGASAADLAELERGMASVYELIETTLGRAVRDIKGAGAAGGMGAALLAFLDAELEAGINVVCTALNLQERIERADLVITGEGAIDRQTIEGKAPIGVARLAARCGVPVVAVGGLLADDAEQLFAHGVDAIEAALTRPVSIQWALDHAEENLVRAGRRIARWLMLSQRLAN